MASGGDGRTVTFSGMKSASSSLTFSGVLVLQKSSKLLLRISLEGEPGPCPKAALLFLGSSSLVSASPPLPD